ncbi:uncharacterized protein LOC128244671 isoform X3 [Mya arenaria]|uniref:uncharacterized protein LOC128244671 isoform X3 n=1 Tax=Mya arenaria TaxID=6604 RepID=UPI0022DEC3C1|nr:uncharacterized protein LOC128244671 isoform X3 [Mya arenaria]
MASGEVKYGEIKRKRQFRINEAEKKLKRELRLINGKSERAKKKADRAIENMKEEMDRLQSAKDTAIRDFEEEKRLADEEAERDLEAAKQLEEEQNKRMGSKKSLTVLAIIDSQIMELERETYT